MKKATKQARSGIIYAGPSLIDGAPIVVTAVYTKSNRKTGRVLQTYILRADMSVLLAIATGQDMSICGGCQARGQGNGKGRTCYVNTGQGPTGVWKKFQRGGYPVAMQPGQRAELGRGRVVRMGTYGDPSAAPAYVWEQLMAEAEAHTGYTHQWRVLGHLQHLCMASADSLEDALEARAAGWRTFRVIFPGQPQRVKGEATCPASREAGAKLQCADCRACSGADGRRGSITILAHGGTAVMANVAKRAA
jgi:hypothetical protein